MANNLKQKRELIKKTSIAISLFLLMFTFSCKEDELYTEYESDTDLSYSDVPRMSQTASSYSSSPTGQLINKSQGISAAGTAEFTCPDYTVSGLASGYELASYIAEDTENWGCTTDLLINNVFSLPLVQDNSFHTFSDGTSYKIKVTSPFQITIITYAAELYMEWSGNDDVGSGYAQYIISSAVGGYRIRFDFDYSATTRTKNVYIDDITKNSDSHNQMIEYLTEAEKKYEMTSYFKHYANVYKMKSFSKGLVAVGSDLYVQEGVTQMSLDGSTDSVVYFDSSQPPAAESTPSDWRAALSPSVDPASLSEPDWDSLW